MDHRRWLDAVEIFERIAELDAVEQRAAIDRACADDAELRAEVERLVRADAAAASRGFLDDAPQVTGAFSGAGDELLEIPPSESRAETLDAPAIERPTRLGPYRVVGEIGRGGMGTIYEAVRDDQTMDQRVAIKVIRSGVESDDIVRRMRVERRILARLEHPNIARIFDAGSTDQGLPYFVMERVDGVPIDAWCDAQDVDIAARLRLVRQVCAAVQYANEQLVVHRDIKPSNILVTADGVPKLLDFGIAKVLDPDQGDEPSPQTEPWRQRATLDYASPEHLIGRPASLSCDVYSLGVLLFRLLTGETPRSPEGTTPWHLDRESALTGPPRPSRVVARRQRDGAPVFAATPRLNRDLDSIVLGALQGDPRARYASAKELGDDLGRYLGGYPVAARHGSWSYRTGKFIRRHAVAVGLSSVIVMLVAALLASVIRSGIEAAEGRSRLSTESAKREQVLQAFLGIFEQAGPLVSEGVPLTLVEAVDRYGERAVAGLAAQPDAEAAVLSALGWVYLDLGDPAKAFDLHQRALDRRQQHGLSEQDQLDSLVGVAASLRDQWQLDEAAERGAEAMRRMADLDDLAPSPRLRALNQHVKLLCFQGAWEEADAWSEQALSLSWTLDPSNAQVPIASSQRAQVLRNLGDLDAARALYESTVDGMRQRYGDEHPVLAALYNNLAEIAFRQKDHHAAIERFRQADAQYVAAYGEDYYDRVRPLNNWGRALVAAGRADDAEPVLRAAIRVALESPALSARHQRRYFGVPAVELAKLLIATERCAEVVELFEGRVEGWKESKTTTKARDQLQQCRTVLAEG